MKQINNYITEKLKIGKDTEDVKYDSKYELGNAAFINIDQNDGQMIINKARIIELGNNYVVFKEYKTVKPSKLDSKKIRIDNINKNGFFEYQHWNSRNTYNCVLLPVDDAIDLIDIIHDENNQSKKDDWKYLSLCNIPMDKYMDENVGKELYLTYDDVVRMNQTYYSL